MELAGETRAAGGVDAAPGEVAGDRPGIVRGRDGESAAGGGSAGSTANGGSAEVVAGRLEVPMAAARIHELMAKKLLKVDILRRCCK